VVAVPADAAVDVKGDLGEEGEILSEMHSVGW
jgi:hypothetical protein